MGELNPQPLPPRGSVQVYVNGDVLYNLEKMQKITAEILGRLGCGGCHSGHVLDFQHLQEFVVNPQTLEVEEIFGGKRF